MNNRKLMNRITKAMLVFSFTASQFSIASESVSQASTLNKSDIVVQNSRQIRSAMSVLLGSKELRNIELALSSNSDDVRLAEIKLRKTIRIPGEAPELHFSVGIGLRKGTRFVDVSYVFVLRLQRVGLGPATTGYSFMVQSVVSEPNAIN